MIRWTGRGWIGAALWFLVMGVAAVIAVTVGGGSGAEVPLIAFAVINVLIGVPVSTLVGRRLNARRTPQGAVRTFEHTWQFLPVERTGVIYVMVSAVALGAALTLNRYRSLVCVLAIVTLVGVFVFFGWATREARAAAKMPPEAVIALAYAQGAPADLVPERVADKTLVGVLGQRWSAYGDEVQTLLPRGVSTGTVGGYAFTVFDTYLQVGNFLNQTDSLRTICVVHLPVALPDLRLRPRIPQQSQPGFGETPAVALEPPWSVDLVSRLQAVSMLGDGIDPTSSLIAEADVPGFAEAMVTGAVVAASVRRGLVQWRVHGSDLIFVTMPGRNLVLSAAAASAVVVGLTEIAHNFPPEALQRFRTN